MISNRWIVFDPTDTTVVETLLKKNTREREEALMVAVLSDAIECYQKYIVARDPKGKKLFQEAEDWILDTADDWLFSFNNICELLRIDPDYLREGLRCWKEATLKRCAPPLPKRRRRVA